MSLIVSQNTNFQTGPAIKSFLGQRRSENANILNYPLGQLIYNKNMEYRYSSGKDVFLATRRGSQLIYDNGSEVYGAGNYLYNFTDNYFVYVDESGNLECLSDELVLTTLTTGIDLSDNTFVMYGAGTGSTLYGCNEVDGVYKVNGSTPTYGSVTSPVMNYIAMSTMSKRMFGVYGHTVYWTQQQVHATDLTNLENWVIGTNNNPVSPDSGSGFNSIIDDGQSMFFFKDTGVWALPNPEEDTANWIFPKVNADVGTRSPKTVKLARYGNQQAIIYLGSDKTLRLLQARVVRNAGTSPTLEGGEAFNISETFQDLLDNIPDGQLSKCTAQYWSRYYILNIVSENSTEIDTTIVIDTDKLVEGGNFAQPFWFEATNMDCTHFLSRSDNSFYGFNKDGYISKFFVNGLFTDACPTRIDASGLLAIPYSAYTGWFKFAEKEVELHSGYVYWKSEGNWNINFSVNSFASGEAIPDYDIGVVAQLSPSNVSGSYFDSAIFDQSTFDSSTGRLSQNTGTLGKKGNYFLFGVYGNNKGEYATLYSIEPIFKIRRSSPISRR